MRFFDSFYAADSSMDNVDFAFLYGILPTANSALVIVRLNGASQPLLAMISSSLSFGKLCAFLLLFVGAALSTVRMSIADEAAWH